MHSCAGRQIGQADRTPAEKLREFRDHAISFGVVNSGLLALNLLTSPHELWFQWPLCGWGIGLAAQGLALWPHLGGWYAGRRAALPAPPLPCSPVSDAERERPWPDLEER